LINRVPVKKKYNMIIYVNVVVDVSNRRHTARADLERSG